MKKLLRKKPAGILMVVMFVLPLVVMFLKEPLIRRFGQEWYEELCEVAKLFDSQKD